MRYLLFLLLLSLTSFTLSKEVKSIDRTVLKYVFFSFNSSAYISSESEKEYKKEYERLNSLMNYNSDIIIVLHGYQNQQERNNLAEQRALKVREDLIQIGIDSNRIEIIAEPVMLITNAMEEDEKLLTQKVDFSGKPK